jgi:hypothetical protein
MSFQPPALSPSSQSTTLRFSAHVWFHRALRTSQPPRPAVLIMLADIERQLRAAGAMPVLLTCETWPPGAFVGDNNHARDHLARLTIEAEPGELKRQLVCWYEWQHPRWRFAGDGGAAPQLSAEQACLSPPAQAARRDAGLPWVTP